MTAAVDAAVEIKGEPLTVLGALASIAAKPASRAATKITPFHDTTKHDDSVVYIYSLPPLSSAELEVMKDRPTEWVWTFDADVSPSQFSPTGNVTTLFAYDTAVHITWYEIHDGPLAGVFLGYQSGGTIETLVSPGWAKFQDEDGISAWLRKNRPSPKL